MPVQLSAGADRPGGVGAEGRLGPPGAAVGAWLQRPLHDTLVVDWLVPLPDAAEPRQLLDCAGWAVDPRALVPCLMFAQPPEPGSAPGAPVGTHWLNADGAGAGASTEVEARKAQVDAQAALARKAEAHARLQRDMDAAAEQMAAADNEVNPFIHTS